MQTSTRLFLAPVMFTPREKTLIQFGQLTVTMFVFDSGVAGLRISNTRGEIIVLPYQGQQIWRAKFDDRNITMRSMFDQPHPTRQYLENYGAFLLHCGFTAMGVPSQGDTHPLHGELPNAPYEDVYIEAGEDEAGRFILIGGRYQHTVAFNYNYLAEPKIRLYESSALIHIDMAFENLKQSPMNYMYLAHINFRPTDNAELIYSANCTPEKVRVRTSVPSHVHPMPGYTEFIDELQLHPELHHRLSPSLKFDPEVVLYVDYLADEDGWAHTIQIHPDGSGDYVRHRIDQLDKGIRWICRTPDQDAIGIVLPATAEPEGYLAEKLKGNLKVLSPNGKIAFSYTAGVLAPSEVKQKKERIASILKKI